MRVPKFVAPDVPGATIQTVRGAEMQTPGVAQGEAMAKGLQSLGSGLMGMKLKQERQDRIDQAKAEQEKQEEFDRVAEADARRQQAEQDQRLAESTAKSNAAKNDFDNVVNEVLDGEDGLHSRAGQDYLDSYEDAFALLEDARKSILANVPTDMQQVWMEQTKNRIDTLRRAENSQRAKIQSAMETRAKAQRTSNAQESLSVSWGQALPKRDDYPSGASFYEAVEAARDSRVKAANELESAIEGQLENSGEAPGSEVYEAEAAALRYEAYESGGDRLVENALDSEEVEDIDAVSDTLDRWRNDDLISENKHRSLRDTLVESRKELVGSMRVKSLKTALDEHISSVSSMTRQGRSLTPDQYQGELRKRVGLDMSGVEAQDPMAPRGKARVMKLSEAEADKARKYLDAAAKQYQLEVASAAKNAVQDALDELSALREENPGYVPVFDDLSPKLQRELKRTRSATDIVDRLNQLRDDADERSRPPRSGAQEFAFNMLLKEGKVTYVRQDESGELTATSYSLKTMSPAEIDQFIRDMGGNVLKERSKLLDAKIELSKPQPLGPNAKKALFITKTAILKQFDEDLTEGISKIEKLVEKSGFESLDSEQQSKLTRYYNALALLEDYEELSKLGINLGPQSTSVEYVAQQQALMNAYTMNVGTEYVYLDPQGAGLVEYRKKQYGDLMEKVGDGQKAGPFESELARFSKLIEEYRTKQLGRGRALAPASAPQFLRTVLTTIGEELAGMESTGDLRSEALGNGEGNAYDKKLFKRVAHKLAKSDRQKQQLLQFLQSADLDLNILLPATRNL